MDKEKQKEKCRYAENLDEKHKKRYFEKLEAVNGFDDFDPYKCREKDFESDFNLLPPLAHGDIVYYLVWGISAFSKKEIKNYKSLEAYQQFTFGWVNDLKIYTPANCDNTLIKAKVLQPQRLNEKPLQPWVIIDKHGVVVSAHCDCMAGLAESCTHVGALLFKIDAVVRLREQQTMTGVPASWMEPTVGFKIDFAIDSNQPMQNTVWTGCTRTSVPNPTEEEARAFFEGLHLTGHKAAILSIIPEYCHHYVDPVTPVFLPK